MKRAWGPQVHHRVEWRPVWSNKEIKTGTLKLKKKKKGTEEGQTLWLRCGESVWDKRKRWSWPDSEELQPPHEGTGL